jgi:GNAT superfamily N-acetyltransferase
VEVSVPPASIRRLEHVDARALDGLADVLIDCVDGGASVGFMQPIARATALAFWQGVAGDVARGERELLVAEDALGVVGTVQLVYGLPENQPHRADLSKMLVHRRARRQGIGAALLQAAEDVARDRGTTLLVLDTASDGAERLYARQGWQRVGVVPGFALMPDGAPCATTFFYRELAGSTAART